MKQYKLYITGILFLILFIACDVNTLDEVKKLDQVVSLVQVGDGTVVLTQGNLIVDKENKLFKKGFGVALSGFGANQGFDVDLELLYNEAPEGCAILTADECFLTLTENSLEKINRLTVPAGVQEKAFYLNLTGAVIDNHPGEVVGVKVKISNLGSYKLNPADTLFVTLNTADFSSKKIEITDTYFLNSTFQREAGTTTRFAPLADWTSNDGLQSSRPDTGAGYDDNCGYLGIERWGSYDNPIINGKIYQTFTLPKGRYLAEADMKKVAVERDTYLLVGDGADLPNDTQITTAVASAEITDEWNNKVLPLEFELAAEKEVSIGFLINIENEVQRILQVSKIRLYRLESFFD